MVNNLLQFIRGFGGFILFVVSVVMTFKGFPFALLSWFGGGVITVAYTVAISTMTHEDVGHGKDSPRDRFIRICLGFAIASLGAAMVEWGGLISIGVGGSFVIPFRETGILIGIASGLYNIDAVAWTPGQITNKEN